MNFINYFIFNILFAIVTMLVALLILLIFSLFDNYLFNLQNDFIFILNFICKGIFLYFIWGSFRWYEFRNIKHELAKCAIILVLTEISFFYKKTVSFYILNDYMRYNWDEIYFLILNSINLIPAIVILEVYTRIYKVTTKPSKTDDDNPFNY